MAVKDGAKYLAEAVESVLNQTLPVREFLVINDHSSDNTLNILESYLPDLEILSHEKSGQASALNLGLLRSKNDFISFIDHDDIWHHRKNEISMEAILTNELIDVVCCGLVNFESNLETNAKRDFSSPRLFGTCLFRRSSFDSVGLLDSTLQNHAIVEWWTRENARKLKVESVSETLYFRRIHEKNSGILKRTEARSDLFSILRRAKVAEGKKRSEP
jgi:glycosyltransferase involved in cell wall biosynthesis